MVVDSLTPTAKQKDWKTPCEFLCCPLTITGNPINSYYKNLTIGKTFIRNPYGESVTERFALVDEEFILILTDISKQSGVKNYALSKIECKDGFYLHTNLGTFFTYEGAEKNFLLEQGLEWTGGETFDDYC